MMSSLFTAAKKGTNSALSDSIKHNNKQQEKKKKIKKKRLK